MNITPTLSSSATAEGQDDPFDFDPAETQAYRDLLIRCFTVVDNHEAANACRLVAGERIRELIVEFGGAEAIAATIEDEEERALQLDARLAGEPVPVPPEEPVQEPPPAIDDNNQFTIVENCAIEHPECGAYEIAAYVCLVHNAHMPKTVSALSIAGAADMMNCQWRTARDAFHRLEKLGLIKAVGTASSGATRYKIVYRHRAIKKEDRKRRR
jgi:hypothetical protein